MCNENVCAHIYNIKGSLQERVKHGEKCGYEKEKGVDLKIQKKIQINAY